MSEKRNIPYLALGGVYGPDDVDVVSKVISAAALPGGDFFPMPEENLFQEAFASHEGAARAVAVMDGVVVATDSEKLRKVCEEDHDLGYFVMRRLANVVASRLMVTRLQLLDMFAEPTEKKNA